MQIISIIKNLKELSGKSPAGKELAMEAASLFSFLMAGQDGRCTVHLLKEDTTVLFYSSLPDDEAGFWKCPLSAAKERGQIREGSQILTLPPVGKYEGFLILEDCRGGNGFTSEDMESLLWIFQSFWCMCLLAEEAENNYFTDPVTELPGITVFKQAVSQSMESKQEGYLVVARVPVRPERPYSENSMDCRIQELARYCRKTEGITAYRIAADMIAVLAEGEKGMALDYMQKIMLLLPETSLFLTSLAFLKEEKVLTRIQEEMGKLGEGSTAIKTGRPSPRLPIFTKGREKGDGNGKA
ncbi:MAG: hypothetical protein J1E98_08630 [Lachnospiraceae bacterium]|nr:hypothetical protein [Lachnospiraceae bacterium]